METDSYYEPLIQTTILPSLLNSDLVAYTSMTQAINSVPDLNLRLEIAAAYYDSIDDSW